VTEQNLKWLWNFWKKKNLTIVDVKNLSKLWASFDCEDMEWKGREKVEINLYNVAMIKRHPLFVRTKGTTCIVDMNVFLHIKLWMEVKVYVSSK
jgi:hypothetical protein